MKYRMAIERTCILLAGLLMGEYIIINIGGIIGMCIGSFVGSLLIFGEEGL